MMTTADSFRVSAEAYDRFMGRYSRPLALALIDFAGIEAGARTLDVGCGPGALIAALAERCGETRVVGAAPAEDLPFDDGSFDATLSQLVVNFMNDPAAGAREMRRVTRAGGVVASCVW